MKILFATFLCSLLLTTSCNKPVSSSTNPTTIYVSGTVTDKKTNAPLDSVTVKLLRSATMTYPTVELELKTDINGKYNFKFSQDDSFGSRAISCYKEGYKPLTNVHVESNIESQVINASLEK